MFGLSSGEKIALEASAGAIERQRMLQSGTVSFEKAEEVHKFMLEMTGSEDAAEKAVFNWRQKRLESGGELT